MNKRDLSERDICTKFITPAVKQAGWDEMAQIREEVSFTKGRIIVRGKLVTRGKAKRADYIGALELRERVIVHLAVFVGMRPGEILGLQRQHVEEGCRAVTISQRLYRGDIDTPKTRSSRRIVAVPTKTASLMQEWMELVSNQSEAWVFVSENP